MLITGDIPVTMVSGPVGAVAVMGQTVEQGAGTSYLDALILFAAVSANLGIMNLLPLPALVRSEVTLPCSDFSIVTA